MSIGAVVVVRSELLLGQLVQSSDDFRCPFCGFAFAPAYATAPPPWPPGSWPPRPPW